LKKLDLHIHTKSTLSDSSFDFSLERLKEYIEDLKIDGIAITNHNTFDKDQFEMIRNELIGICEVLPGIEINIGLAKGSFGHLICISDYDKLENFSSCCDSLNNKIIEKNDCINPDELKSIFGDLSQYLLIPHYDKKPPVNKEILEDLKSFVHCGEVGSPKKFIYCIKDSDSLTPVYFSDLRISDEISHFPSRQTFFNIDEINVSSINKAVLNKSSVALTEEEGVSSFYVLPGLPISTGLTVILGERSSGKTYTLNEINDIYENIKYIKQFQLIETDPEKAEKSFTDSIASKKSSIVEAFFEEFKKVINSIVDVSLDDDYNNLENYISSLVKYANEQDRMDMFARCSLYNESKFSIGNTKHIKELIQATEKLLDSNEYQEIILRHIKREDLISLHKELIIKYRKEYKFNIEKEWINTLICNIKTRLKSNSSAQNVPDINFYDIQLDRIKVNKFNELVEAIKYEKEINHETLGDFSIVTSKKPFMGPLDLKKHSGKRNISFSSFFDFYNKNPYEFLLELKKTSIDSTDYYSFFANVDYAILNRYGCTISGGERAEFNLLQEINDAMHYDMLLIDEPESSFDNIFLKEKVNTIIKKISGHLPVIIVTHNNTVGASIKPDYLVFTKRIIQDDKPLFERYYGLPSSKDLVSSLGKKIKNFNVVIDCLEAGENSYYERRDNYEILKN